MGAKRPLNKFGVWWITAVVLPLAFFGLAAKQASNQPAEPSEIQFVELVLRNRATKQVMPVYPPKSEKLGHSGVAVGQVTVDHGGRVSAVQILQAPDDAIRKAVAKALQNWTFRPETIHGVPIEFTGELTFYLVIKNGKGMVLNPNQMPKHK
ncbi:MAG: TonB family protein [Terriglobia bacterium]